MSGPETFRFLSVERAVRCREDWNRADWSKLWLYNAHYFDDLMAEGAGLRSEWHQSMISRWILENPPGRGNGWEPYPISLRVVNWLKWLKVGNAPVPGMLDSLVAQVRWLRMRMEHHLLGNHLWANAKALVFAGSSFDGEEARGWLRQGIRLMRREIREQILSDGGHFERSPMYHAILTEDLLDLVQLAEASGHAPVEFVDECRSTAIAMLGWAAAMSHPDGDVAFFNDSALGVAPDLKSLQEYAACLGLSPPPHRHGGVVELNPSGYVRLEHGSAVLLADVAPVGPDYLPGHAHADTLSFELSVNGRRVLVNGGTSTYENSPERHRQRGTASHNTVTIDGKDSSEVWAAFRVARRARVYDVVCQRTLDGHRLSAWHDGYRRLRGRVIHRRTWVLRNGELQVDDVLDGDFQTAEARFLFAPRQSLRWQVEGGDACLVPAVWYPRFGESIETTCLVVRFTGPRCRVVFLWS